MQGRTSFVIAQRIVTVQRAREILVFDGGRITERGTHSELIQRPGFYRDLYELQKNDAGADAQQSLSVREGVGA